MGGGTPKQFLALQGRPLLVWTLAALASWRGLRGMVVVAPPDELDRVRGLIDEGCVARVLRVVAGGAERQDSVRLGLDSLTEAAADDLVLVHDGARPFPPVHVFETLCEAARPAGAVLAMPCRDTLKREQDGVSCGTVDRSHLWQAQTPQAFPVGLLRHALSEAQRRGEQLTDEAALLEAMGLQPRLVPGDPRNIKVTTPEDLELAEALAARSSPSMRLSPRLRQGHKPAPGGCSSGSLHVGHGYDVHRLVEGRRLVLGGVEIPFEKGLLGHSDADVLAHAVADACLGAAGLGDIGRHFPDTDPRWRGASSLRILAQVAQLLLERGFQVYRVDATLVAERPKVSRHVAEMERQLSGSLSAAAAEASGGQPLVSVKATTTEGLGFEGRGEGMSAHAVALLGNGRGSMPPDRVPGSAELGNDP